MRSGIELSQFLRFFLPIFTKGDIFYLLLSAMNAVYPRFFEMHNLAELYPYIRRLYKMYIVISKHFLFYFPLVPSVSSVRRGYKV